MMKTSRLFRQISFVFSAAMLFAGCVPTYEIQDKTSKSGLMSIDSDLSDRESSVNKSDEDSSSEKSRDKGSSASKESKESKESSEKTDQKEEAQKSASITENAPLPEGKKIEEDPFDPAEVYGPILRRYQSGEMLDEWQADESVNNVGYQFIDLSGDGLPEMIISSLGYDDHYNNVLALYAAPDGIPVKVISSWARSRNQYLTDGTFVFNGSGGAAYGYLGHYTLSHDGTQQIWSEYMFTEPTDSSQSSVSVYSNNTGSDDPAQSTYLGSNMKIYSDRVQELTSRPDYVFNVTPIVDFR